MNRIQLADLPPQPVTKPNSAALNHVDSQLRYNLFGPIHYEANYAYPLLIWLHGTDSDESQLQEVMPLISVRNYVGVAPAAPNCWQEDEHGWHQSQSGIEQAERDVMEAIRIASQRFHVGERKVYLAGYRSGGTMALRLGLRQPGFFAGAACLGGPFPHGDTPFRHLGDARGLPMLIGVGEESEEYPTSQLCEDIKLFHAAGMHATIRQYSCGDELNQVMLRDLNAWIMEHVTGIPSGERDTKFWNAN